MVRWWQSLWVFGAIVLVLGLVLMLPLRLVTGDTGLTARAVSGCIWSGKLVAAQWRGADLGDLAVGLQPLALLTGRLRMGFDGPNLRGIAGPEGVSALSGHVAVAGATPLPITSVGFDDVEIAFAGGTCTAARGQINVAGTGVLGDSGGFSGAPRCESGALLLPLAAGSSRIDLRFDGNGAWRGVIAVNGVTESARPGLLGAGFAPTPQGLAMTLEGQL
ncbi:MAG: type II secretion system protein N [Polymorphobacter sp.]